MEQELFNEAGEELVERVNEMIDTLAEQSNTPSRIIMLVTIERVIKSRCDSITEANRVLDDLRKGLNTQP